jgi:hypothetical protein
MALLLIGNKCGMYSIIKAPSSTKNLLDYFESRARYYSVLGIYETGNTPNDVLGTW